VSKKGKLIIVVLPVAVAVAAAYLYWDSRKAPVIPKSDGEAEMEQEYKAGQRPLYIGFIPQGNAVFMVKKWQPLADYLTKEMEMNKSSVFCCVLSFLMIFLSYDIKRENRCNQNQVQDSAN